MKTDRYVFPAIFFRDGNVVGVRFPDLPGCNTCGDDQEDALTMARDALGGHLLCLEDLGEAIPTPTSFDKIRTKKNEVVALIEVRMSILREEDRKRAQGRHRARVAQSDGDGRAHQLFEHAAGSAAAETRRLGSPGTPVERHRSLSENGGKWKRV